MGFTEQQRIFQIEAMGDKLGWNRTRIAVVANRFGIVGASEPNLTKASNKTKDLSPQTAAELLTLMQRYTKMAAAFAPFKLRVDDPDEAKQLLEDYEAGRLVVSVRKEKPGALVYRVHLIESLLEPNTFFEGIQNNKPSWGTEGRAIRDFAIADAAVGVLRSMGAPCHSVVSRIRTTEEQIAKSMADLGLIEKEN
jgi:hypothetical protein